MPVIHDRAAWDTIKGIAFRKEGKIQFTGSRDLIEDLDSLPVPARHLLSVSRYLALGFPVSIITSRGCPNKCIFCQGRRMVGYKVRYRSPGLIVDEIEEILSYGFTRINIADDLFTSSKKRVQAFCDELKRRNIKLSWSAFARVNTVDHDLLSIMRDAGCDAVSFGIESGNTQMLKRVRKGITLDQARNAVQVCKDTGMTAYASFMIGLPGESPQTIDETRAFADSLGIDYGFHLLAPFPGTTIREEQQNYDIEFLTDDWDLYDANSPVVRTSSLSEQYTAEYMKRFDAWQNEHWNELLKKYKAGTCNDNEYLRVAGHKRMHLVFKILVSDLIEQHGFFLNGNSGIQALADRLTQETGEDHALVYKTLQFFQQEGYIRQTKANNVTQWYWTRNNRFDSPSLCNASEESLGALKAEI